MALLRFTGASYERNIEARGMADLVGVTAPISLIDVTFTQPLDLFVFTIRYMDNCQIC